MTIFGQSGGGSKTLTLMTMPSAKGLFHKAIVESGSILAANTMETSHRVAEKLLKKFGDDPGDLGKLQKMPFAELQAVGDTLNPMPPFINGVVDFIRPALMDGWAPVAGNPVLPQHPFHPKAPEISASVPMIVGCTLNEFIHGIDKPDCFAMAEAELQSQRPLDVEEQEQRERGDHGLSQGAAGRQSVPALVGDRLLFDPLYDAGKRAPQVRARRRAGVLLPFRLADPGARRSPDGVPHLEVPRVRQHRTLGPDVRQRSGGAGAGGNN